MLVDLHMHEKTHSPDSALGLAEMVHTARLLGLDAICITDHDSMGLRREAEQHARQTGFPIFVGLEYYSAQGDIVAFGLPEPPRPGLSAQAFVHLVNRAGGACFAAHPYRSNNRGLKDQLYEVEGLCGIEAFNASTGWEANQRALAACRRLGLQPLGVSDCHRREKLGVYATCLPGAATTLEGFIHLLQKGGGRPLVFHQSRYVDLLSLCDLLEPGTCLLPAGLGSAKAG